MHIKFLKHGSGSGQKATDYLTSDKDHTGKQRTEVTVLRGDPDQVAAVADSLKFKYKYTSGIIAWAPEDNPSLKQINNVLDDFEKTAWAGLDQDRYSWSAILHRDNKGGCHVHVFAARVDLETGKSLNIAPPGHNKIFDALRDYYNNKEDWARPDDPNRARLCQPGVHSHITAARLRIGLNVEPDSRQLITDYLVQKIETGEIENRKDILFALNDAGFETPRHGKQYITVLDPESGKKIRLKGAIYNADFKRTEFERSIEKENRSGSGTNRSHSQATASKAYAELEYQRQKRAEYNQKRFPIDCKSNHQGIVRKMQKNRNSEKQPDSNINSPMDKKQPHRPESLHRHLRRQLGNDAISDIQHPKGNGNQNPTDEHHRATEKPDLEYPIDRGSRRSFHCPSSRSDSGVLYNWGEKSTENCKEVKNGTYRIRTSDDKELEGITKRADQNYRRLIKANEILGRSHRKSYNRLQCSCEDLQRHGEKFMNNELERFKQDINLTEYASQSKNCYTLIKDKSSKSSFYMCGKNGHKISISQNKNTGHDIFNDWHQGKGHGGTIIDFVQKVEGVKNLGEVRKILREYLGCPPPKIKIERPKPGQTPEQQAQVLAKDKKSAKHFQSSEYLKTRGISQEILDDNRFKGRIFTDRWNNVLFPHENKNGFSGFEKKNHEYTRFSSGGTKGFWYSNPPPQFDKIVICESAIDCLSHAQLHPNNNATYVSISGQLSREQEELLKDLIERNPEKEIVAAFDNDECGNRYTSDLKTIKKIGKFTVDMPKTKDWNSELQSKHFKEVYEYNPQPSL